MARRGSELPSPSLQGKKLWLSGGFLLMGLLFPVIFRCFAPNAGESGDGRKTENYTPWQLVEDRGGFRTFTARVPGSGSLSLRGETVADEHIGRLYTAFLNTSSTLDWVRFLSEVEELPPIGGGKARGLDGGILFQKYDMPWPVKDREVVLRRTVRLDKRARKMIATYQSVEHPARPITNAAVRAVVHRTSWILTSVGGGSRTAIDFETSTDPKGALPSAVVAFMQMKFPRETVRGFVESARGVEVHPVMAKW